MSELISSDLRLISVVLQLRLFQFIYTEFKGPSDKNSIEHLETKIEFPIYKCISRH